MGKERKKVEQISSLENRKHINITAFCANMSLNCIRTH